jgi:hypothetical protein
MALHHVRLVPAVSIGQHVETGFTNQPGVQPVQLRQAAAVERTSWEVRTRGQLDSRCLSVGFNQLNFGADEFGTLRTGSRPVQTVSKVGRGTSGVISDFAKKGQDLSLRNYFTFLRNFPKSCEVRQMLPKRGLILRVSVVWGRSACVPGLIPDYAVGFL